MKTLLVLAHPRRASLTGQVADVVIDELTKNGHAVEVADLAAEEFDPVLREPDEPDWNDPRKAYPADVQREMQRIERNDATVMVFPVYWWSVPALLKGWIDRVWNHGWAYGDRFYPQSRVWMIGIAGNDAASFAKSDYDAAMRTSLDIGILEYCHVRERRLELLYGSIDGEQAVAKILADARRLAGEF